MKMKCCVWESLSTISLVIKKQIDFFLWYEGAALRLEVISLSIGLETVSEASCSFTLYLNRFMILVSEQICEFSLRTLTNQERLSHPNFLHI